MQSTEGISKHGAVGKTNIPNILKYFFVLLFKLVLHKRSFFWVM